MKTKSGPRRYRLMCLGSAILSFGMYNIHSQCRITEGGVLGAILLAEHWLGISPSVSGFVMDMSCYLLGRKVLGGPFLKRAVFSSACFSLTYRLWETRPPLLPSLARHPLTAAVAGGIFVGTGVGLVVSQGGAAGGDDALALVISGISGCPISRAYLATDVTVLLLSLSYIPFRRIFFSLVTVNLSSFLIGRIQRNSAKKGQELSVSRL